MAQDKKHLGVYWGQAIDPIYRAQDITADETIAYYRQKLLNPLKKSALSNDVLTNLKAKVSASSSLCSVLMVNFRYTNFL